MPQRPRFLLVTPTASEYAPVRLAVAEWLATGEVELEMCGIGPNRAWAFAGSLDGTGPWRGVALIGWAGGLQPELSIGDVVVADVALDEQGRQVPCTAIELPGAKKGAFLTVRDPLLTRDDKRVVQSSGALVVEMEAYPLAAWAADRNVPFVHARVVLDGLDDSVPDMGNALDSYGRIRPCQLALRVLARPHLAAELRLMAQRVRLLRPTLGQTAREISEAWLR